jgi:hypothetical protein
VSDAEWRGGARRGSRGKFAKQPLFQQGWKKYYPGMIEWLPPMISGGVKSVDPKTMSVETDFET